VVVVVMVGAGGSMGEGIGCGDDNGVDGVMMQ
jgi:hypothetical protein